MPQALLLSFAMLIALATLTRAFISVDPETQFMVDDDGRARLFHGVNAVYKVPPWHPDVSEWNTMNSMTSEDCANLAEWGFTAVRLGVMWPGVEPAPGVYNTSYLAVMEGIINCLGAQGISTIIDAHQDLFSPFFCGEGAPDWAIDQAAAAHAFPWPVAASMPINETTGYPQSAACLSRPFADYYPTDAVGVAFQALYDNTNGLQESFAGSWAAVAAYFATNPYVLGYELLNEPWAGDMYANPQVLAVPGYTDLHYLQPMYDVLAGAIRAVDREHIILFEPAVSDYVTCGLTQPPLGQKNISVFSFHVYCAGTNASGDPNNVPVCDAADALLFDMHFADFKRLGAGGFLTEFGAMLQSPNETAALEYLLALADSNLMSTSYWQYKSFHDVTTSSEPEDESFYFADGTLQQQKVKTLSRTYAYAIAGIPTAMSFNPSTALFQLSYRVNSQVSAPTEIYLNQAWYYPNGFSVAFSPSNGGAFTLMGPNRIAVTSTLPDGAELSVTISATPSL